MVVAGLEHAVELAQLAMEETGFGVFEDKVVKNYIATEFLYDYLKDKRSVGVIDEDPERGDPLRRRADRRRARADADHQPDLDRAVQGDRRGQDAQRDHLPPVGARRALRAMRAVEILQEAGERAGMPPGTLQVIPDPTLDVSQYLFHHPGVDFIWTTGGPKAVAAANAAGKPCLSVGAGNAPVYIHRSADVRDGRRRHADLEDLRRLGDLPGRADLRRRRRRSRTRRWPSSSGWARGCSSDEEAAALGGGRRSTTTGTSELARARPVVRQPRRRWPASRPATDDKVLLAPLPSDLDDARARTRSCTRS